MNVILKTLAGTSALLLIAGSLTACSPTETPDEQTTTTIQTTTTVATTTTQHGSLAASDVIVRSGPGLDYDAIGGISYDEEVTILGREGDWYCIQFGDTVGYISAQYVDVDDAPNASEMVEGLKTTATINTTAVTTTTKAGAKTTTTKAGSATDANGKTSTTKAGGTATSVTGNGATTTTTATGVVTTTTQDGTIPTVDGYIPEVGIVDDF